GLPGKVTLDRAKISDEQIVSYAEQHEFEPFADDGSLNQQTWMTHLNSIDQSRWPEWATISKVTIVPFYDRTGLIYETLGTLSSALSEEMLITFIVVILMVMHLRSSALIGSMLPLAVLLCFIAMKTFNIDANIVALSGIAIAIGTIVDMGIVVSENILRHLESAPPEEPRLNVVHRAASEVGGAVLTAVATTVVSFLPVFVMTGAEGKLFKPLAFTKTFALIASIIIALTILPAAAHLLFCGRIRRKTWRGALFGALAAAGAAGAIFAGATGSPMLALASLAVLLFAVYSLTRPLLPKVADRAAPISANIIVVLLVTVLLGIHWEPLGPERGFLLNFLFVAILVGTLVGFFQLFMLVYKPVLRGCLAMKGPFLALVGLVLLLGVVAWMGFDTVADPAVRLVGNIGLDAENIRSSRYYRGAEKRFPGLGSEFMPDLDEGSFLYMPTTMTHASIGEATDILAKQDQAFRAIPEVDTAVGKVGRAETPLDPAPLSMVETVINYHSEYVTDRDGNRINFRYDPDRKDLVRDVAGTPLLAPDGDPYYTAGRFVRDEDGRLIPDEDGRPFRQWRPALDPQLNADRQAWEGIQSPDDIWDAISRAGEIPGTTAAPKLQPIAARIVMLQSGMRAPMGVKIQGPDLETIERFGLQVEKLLKQVPGVEASAVLADRIIGKPYLEIVPDRRALGRYGVKIGEFQNIVEIAIGGKPTTYTVEGRERYPVRIRYQRELRDDIDALHRILVPGKGGAQIPIEQLAEIRYVRGPQAIKSEDTFLTGYVLFDKKPNEAETDVVERAKTYLEQAEADGRLNRPAGVSYRFAGNYENQIRSRRTLMIVLPVALGTILLILYFQFRSVVTTLLVFSGIFVAWAGGFILLWMYGQPQFMNFSVFGVHMRELFQVHTMNLSVAVWVGFLALFGIATDNGVIQSTYLQQVFRDRRPETVQGIRDATVIAADRRIRPCLMTTATTLLALLPILTSTGRGSDVMVPMAIPSFGGMLVVLLTVFVVPVLYCWVEEIKLTARR
ncbi:MAG: efflux RND transporter permease subunit, partial [Phycisphaerae bacterium]